MAVTIGTVMRTCRNYFEQECAEGEFTVAAGSLSPAVDAPYVYISGSRYHDGVFRMQGDALADAYSLPDETFMGRVWLLYPPRDFTSMVDEIIKYDADNPSGAFLSERFGEYSYTRGSGANGGSIPWETAFASRLTPFRRMFTEVA